MRALWGLCFLHILVPWCLQQSLARPSENNSWTKNLWHWYQFSQNLQNSYVGEMRWDTAERFWKRAECRILTYWAGKSEQRFTRERLRNNRIKRLSEKNGSSHLKKQLKGWKSGGAAVKGVGWGAWWEEVQQRIAITWQAFSVQSKSASLIKTQMFKNLLFYNHGSF